MQEIIFEDFQASRKFLTVEQFSQTYGTEVHENVSNIQFIIAYIGGLSIELRKNGLFYLMIDKEDWLEAELVSLERRLFAFGVGQYYEISERGTNEAIPIDKRAEMTTALTNFETAYNEVNRIWIDEGFLLSKDYPFPVSFDEIPIAKWVRTAHESLGVQD